MSSPSQESDGTEFVLFWHPGILTSWHSDIMVWFSHPVSGDFDSPSLSASLWTVDKTPGDRDIGAYQVLIPSRGLNTFLEWGKVGGEQQLGGHSKVRSGTLRGHLDVAT